MFERSLQLQKIAVLGLLRSVVLFAVTVPLTMALDSPMAIVWASIVAEAVYVVASYIAMWVPVRPSLDVSLLRDLMQYGRWITGSSIAVFLLLYLMTPWWAECSVWPCSRLTRWRTRSVVFPRPRYPRC